MKSDVIVLTVIGGALGLSALHHGAVYRDEYRSRQDCEQDWRRYAAACEAQSSAGASGGGYWGPAYERGGRPQTSGRQLVASTTEVKRAGFGFSGARFSSGGS